MNCSKIVVKILPENPMTCCLQPFSGISGKLVSGLSLFICVLEFLEFVLILLSGKLGCERLPTFLGETYWATTFEFVANFAYHVSQLQEVLIGLTGSQEQ